ncbi:MAG TPA: peptidoglycan DD-metalloendopeptidase family protein [Gemmatimonadales bacterium]|nr:peptidoglycan DD-metalloendopeptidase family protein [Gemmatimonadales bacterium]
MLAVERAPDSSLWVGTYGQGIFVLRRDGGGGTGEAWEQIRASDDTTARSISWDFVHAFAFGPRGEVWYGTVGNGWGLSTDGGRTWRNWGFRELGPEWQYVAPDGIVTRGDTTYIATADGITLTWDDGATWAQVTDSFGAPRARQLWGRIPNQYVLALDREPDGSLVVRVARHGVLRSTDGGRTWHGGDSAPADGPLRSADLPGNARSSADAVRAPAGAGGGDQALARPEPLRHTWFQRPIARTDQPHIDQTYRFGSTMGGNFQAHQGVEFNNPDGTPVHAIGDGAVVLAGEAESGALTVAIRHDRVLEVAGSRFPPPGSRFVYSVYYHNSRLLVRAGDRVRGGDVIALVGNTGRATNDHVHLEVHVLPVDSTALVVDPAVRYPPYNANPELWIEPLPGTGVVAGQVHDSGGNPVPQARIYGIVKPQPRETPFSFIETYGPRNHRDPVYQEHFAIGDVPPGEYLLGVGIHGERVYRRVLVESGKLTWVEFRPADGR